MPGRAKRIVYPPLTETERRYIDRFLADFGDDPIIVAMHASLLSSLRRACLECRMDLDDIRQSGMVGVIKAARHFNPRHRSRKGKGPPSFKTYAIWWIRSEVGHELARHRGEQMRAKNPLPRLALTEDVARRLSNTRSSGPEESAARDEDAVIARSILERLEPREELILRGRFGIDSPVRTQEDIGRELGICKERVRQIEGKALRCLKRCFVG